MLNTHLLIVIEQCTKKARAKLLLKRVAKLLIKN